VPLLFLAWELGPFQQEKEKNDLYLIWMVVRIKVDNQKSSQNDVK
jgi:hypothetical protein